MTYKKKSYWIFKYFGFAILFTIFFVCFKIFLLFCVGFHRHSLRKPVLIRNISLLLCFFLGNDYLTLCPLLIDERAVDINCNYISVLEWLKQVFKPNILAGFFSNWRDVKVMYVFVLTFQIHVSVLIDIFYISVTYG